MISQSLLQNTHHSTFGQDSNNLQLWVLYSIPVAASNMKLQYHESNESWNTLQTENQQMIHERNIKHLVRTF